MIQRHPLVERLKAPPGVLRVLPAHRVRAVKWMNDIGWAAGTAIYALQRIADGQSDNPEDFARAILASIEGKVNTPMSEESAAKLLDAAHARVLK